MGNPNEIQEFLACAGWRDIGIDLTPEQIKTIMGSQTFARFKFQKAISEVFEQLVRGFKVFMKAALKVEENIRSRW